MKSKLSRILFLILAASIAVSAQTAQRADPLEKNLRAHVEYLASDKLEGRRTGEPGATSAAGYVANQFAQLKLKPGMQSAKHKGNFLQPFPHVSGVTLGKDNFLRIIPSDPTRENKMESGINWMPLGFSPSADIPPLPLVFAGYGISANELKYDDYAGLDVKDKIVLIFDGAPDAANPHSQFGRFNIHTKASIAKDKGARAIILIAADGDFKNDRLSRLSYDRTLGETALPVVGIMRQHGAELLGAKDAKELDEIEKWIAMKTNAPPSIQIRLANPPATAQVMVDLAKRQTEAYNVIGILEGNDPVLKREAIVIGAHYDHLGRGGSGSLVANSSDIHHGADDNASGTSAVIELARQFAKEKKNKRTMIFMAFSGEEEGLLGSKFYVENPVWPLDKTVAMINMDMVGRLNEGKLTIGGIGTASEFKATVEQINSINDSDNGVSEEDRGKQKSIVAALYRQGIRGLDVIVAKNEVTITGKASKDQLATIMQTAMEPKPVKLTNRMWTSATPQGLYLERPFILQLNEDGFGPSDHSSFYGKKIPVLFFFTGTHLDYHKPSDTADKINFEGLSKITSYVAAIARSVDQNPTRPTYTTAKASGTPGGRMAFTVSLGTIPSYADSTDGLVLDGVRDGSPAEKAGLKAGDKIFKLAGKDVRNAMDYTYVMGTMKAGEEYEVVIKRGTETLTMKIVPAPAARR